ncbi:MAG: hypothetical protein PHY59_00745 [Methanobacterium sp.]|nr:hypothetical protein [Methanobacterium sp.]
MEAGKNGDKGDSIGKVNGSTNIFLTIEHNGKSFNYLQLSNLYKSAEEDNRIVAIAGQKQVKDSYKEDIKNNRCTDRNKKSFAKWDQFPTGWKGINDPDYGSAIICDYILIRAALLYV